jgi:hypothetical protein
MRTHKGGDVMVVVKIIGFILLALLGICLTLILTGVGLFIAIFGESAIWIARIVIIILLAKWLWGVIWD